MVLALVLVFVAAESPLSEPEEEEAEPEPEEDEPESVELPAEPPELPSFRPALMLAAAVVPVVRPVTTLGPGNWYSLKGGLKT